MYTKKKYKRTKHRRKPFLGTRRKRTYRKRGYKQQILKGGHGMLAALGTIQPAWREGRATLVKAINFPLYITSLPIWNRESMRNILRYYLINKNIKTIINLQGCGSPNVPHLNLMSCLEEGGDTNPNLENDIFEEIKLLQPDPNVRMLDNTIQDMTAGNINIWLNISNTIITNNQGQLQSTLIHCLAGYGRSGTVLLFFLLLLSGNNNYHRQYMGHSNSTGMYNYLRTFLRSDHIRIDTDPDTEINNRIRRMLDYMVSPAFENSVEEEVFNINDLHHINLLISRINYIILFLAYKNNYMNNQIIYLYRLYDPLIHRTELFVPVEVRYNNEINQTSLIQHNIVTN